MVVAMAVIVDLPRCIFTVRAFERALLRWTRNRPYVGIVSKLPPNPWQYSNGTFRDVKRYGFSFTVDLSDLMGWYLYWGFIDPSHERLLELIGPHDNVIDIGANIGVTALRISELTGGQVLAIEPDPTNYADLVRHVSANGANVQTVNAAASDRAGLGYLAARDDHNRGMHSLAEFGTEVILITIDDLAEDFEVDLIKIDVEGHEVSALRGATKTISRCQPTLYIEVNEHLLRKGGSSVGALVALLEGHGYTLHRADNGAPYTVGGGAVDVIAVHGQLPRTNSAPSPASRI